MIHMPLCRGLSRARVCVAGPSCLCHNAQNRQRGAPGTVHRYHIHVCLTLSRVLESCNCHLIGSYYLHLRLVVLESFSNFQTRLSNASKKPILTCHLAILKWPFSPLFLLEAGLSAEMGRGEGGSLKMAGSSIPREMFCTD